MKLSSSLRISVVPWIILIVSALIAPAQSHRPHPGTIAPASYGRLPLSFESNRGQADPNIQFLSRGAGYLLLLDHAQANLVLPVASPDNSQPPSLIHISPAGANPNPTAIPENQQITRTNYFLGDNPANWRTDIPNYARIRYRSVYPGIDLVYYGNQRQLEHDFLIAPNANPARIALTLSGLGALSIDSASGALILTSANQASGSLRLLRPVAYQQIHGHRVPVRSAYKLLTTNKVGFSLGRYDHSRPLVIDPALTYSTYLGGSGSGGHGDQGNSIAVDSAGSAYITGVTYSVDFPVTTGAFQTQNHAASNNPTVFVSKLSPDGSSLVYSTYLGGSGGDFGYGIALDTYGSAYITGVTRSTDFPVTCNAYQAVNPSTTSGATTAFVSRLTPAGDDLVYSTYLGGSGNQASSGGQGDVAQAIAVDSTFNAYITGYTYSADFPISTSAFQVKFAGTTSTSNAFVTKLNPAGTSLLYSTYLGGNGTPAQSPTPALGDSGNAIAIDGAGDAFVAGATASPNFPVTKAAFRPSLTGPINAFITELNPGGTAEVYSTYLGGSGQPVPQNELNTGPATGDTATGIAVDSSGSIYVAGNTTSPDFPVTSGVLEGSSDFDGQTGFVTKFSPDGTSLLYSTYLEGVGTSIAELAIDSAGNAYLAGLVPSQSLNQPGGFATTTDAIASPGNPNVSAFVVKLDPKAEFLNYATFLGGSSIDVGTALAVDTAGNAYITGGTTSSNFPITAGAFQSVNHAPNNAGGNAFSSQLALASKSDQTIYPTMPTGIATSIGDTNATATFNCFPGGGPAGMITLQIGGVLSAAAAGPPFTGTITFTDSLYLASGAPLNSYTSPIYIDWDSPQLSLQFTDGQASNIPSGPYPLDWGIAYSGDSVYAPSSAGGEIDAPGCPPDSNISTKGALGNLAPQIKISLRPASTPAASSATFPISAASSSTPATSLPEVTHLSKFAPPAGPPPESHHSASRPLDSAPACVAPAQTATPAFSVAADTYTSAQTVSIVDATPGAAIYYTTDGSTPTTSSTLYTTPITVPTTETLQAIASASGYTVSTVASATYTITPPAAAPTFSVPAGTYTSAQTVAIADATPMASIYYTTDGSPPTASSTLYSGPITVSVSETLQAIATAPGYSASPVASAAYTINLPPPSFTVSVSPASLTISPGQSGTATISIAPQNGFALATTFSCSGQPTGVTCSFSPSTVTPSGGTPATTTLTITVSSSAALRHDLRGPFSRAFPLSGPTLAIAVFLLGWKKRREIKWLSLVLLAVLIGAGVLAGCGGSSKPKPTTSAVTVIATSGAIRQSVPLTVTIQ